VQQQYHSTKDEKEGEVCSTYSSNFYMLCNIMQQEAGGTLSTTVAILMDSTFQIYLKSLQYMQPEDNVWRIMWNHFGIKETFQGS
jgi:hypothetical protein